MSDSKSITFVQANGPRPPFPSVAVFLWGSEIDYDSDGNASALEDTAWTELTLVNRGHPNKRVDVDPVSESPLILKIEATTQALAAKAAYFLAVTTSGKVAQSIDGPWHNPESIRESVRGFNLHAATLRAIWFCRDELNHAEIQPPDYVAAHEKCGRHRSELLSSAKCGCFYCLSIFEPTQIDKWIDEQQTAICPRCGIDSVIGSASKYPITRDFLKLMNWCWFNH